MVVTANPIATGELIGRERERAALAQAAAAVGTGQGGFLLLAGEAGVGKTALARHALAASGLRLIEGAAYPGICLPYGPLVAALRSARPTPGAAGGLINSALALMRIDLGATSDAAGRPALFEAARAALAALAHEQPTALFLDDLHWADSDSLDLLAPLAMALASEPLLVIGAYRSDETPRSHPLRRLRSELRRAGRLHELTIEPLDAAHTHDLAARLLGSPPGPALTAMLYDRTEGVPFFLEELTASLATGGQLAPGQAGLELAAGGELPLPESVRDAVQHRVVGLPEPARRALEVAAVAGLEFNCELMGALVGDDEEWLTPLLEQGLVVEAAPGRAAFRHALLREACYLDLPWPRRRALHRQLAARLEADGVPPALVAEHWLAGREPERARRALLAAADASRRVHAYRDAGVALRRALELWPEGADEAGRLDALDRLGQCAELVGDLAETTLAWREVAEGHRRGDGLRELAEVERRLAGVYERQGAWELALASRQAAAEAFIARDLPAEAATERLAAAAHLRSAAWKQAAERRWAQRPDLVACARALEGNVRARMGQVAAGVELVRIGLALALERNLVGAASEIYQRLADSLEHAGDYAGAKEAYLTAFAYCQANAVPVTAQLCLACLTCVLGQTGEWDRAVDLCREVLDAPSSSAHARAVASTVLGCVTTMRGQPGRARPLLLEGGALARQIELVAMELTSAWGLAVVDQLGGAIDSALERCRAILVRWQRTEERHYAVPLLRWAATYCAEQGAAGETRACAAALAEIAAATGQPEALAALASALGELALLDGQAEPAVGQFGQALALMSERQFPLERAQIERRAGHALARAGRREAAVERYRAAYRTAARVGARPLSQQIAAELAALGEPVARRLGRRAARQLAQGGLSRRELEVLRLVVLGRTSREIARDLVLSPRTVEMYVQNILTKLDCRSRAEATRKAAELGLLG